MATHGYKPATKIGGPVVSVAATAERLVERGHDVTILTSDSNLTERLSVDTSIRHEINGVKIWYNRTFNLTEAFGFSKKRRRLGYLYSFDLRKRAVECMQTADIVHLQMPFVYPTYCAATEARRQKVPYFYQQRGVFDPARMRVRGIKKKVFFRLREAGVIDNAAGLIALTQQEVESYRGLGCRNEIYLIPNGIDVPEAEQLVNSRTELSKFSLDPARSTIIFLGRVNSQKGVQILFDAFLLARKSRRDLQLLIAGPDEDGIGQAVARQAHAGGVASDVKVIGHVDGIVKRRLLAESQLFCLPSNAEGFSMAVLESLAVGTPVLLTPGCNFQEVESAGVGEVVGRNVKELAAGLGRTAFVCDESDGNRQRVRDFVRKNYHWDKVTDSLEKAYEQALA